MAQSIAYLEQFFETIRDERGLSKNTATRIGTAFLLLLDYLAAIEYPYLRNDIADTAKGHITFLKGLSAAFLYFYLTPGIAIFALSLHRNEQQACCLRFFSFDIICSPAACRDGTRAGFFLTLKPFNS